MLIELVTVLIVELEQREEVAGFVAKHSVSAVGVILPAHGTLARVLDLEGRREDDDLVQAPLITRGQDHAADARIQRDVGESATDTRERRGYIARLGGPELKERLGRVGDRCCVGWIKKSELRERTQAERLETQQHAGEIGPSHFGISERRAGIEALAAEQADADARCDAPAAPGPLLAARSTDRLDRQPLDLALRVIAAEPSQPRVNHVANTRHGE